MVVVFGLVVIVVLGVTVLVGTTLGGRYRVAPPVLLLVLGFALGLVPALSRIELDPEVVLVLFLPAILYWESLNTSWREIRANLRVILLVSIVLVVLTAAAVATAAQALGVDARAAWVLGAVLAPTDAAAVAGLARQLPRRTLTTLRAESLLNDGTALVLFAIAVTVATGADQLSAGGLVGRFLGSYGGGLVAGLLVGWLVVQVRRRLDDPLREGALSVLTPFAAFLAADIVHASGVVAVVVAGLILTRAGPRVIRARSRLQAYAFWSLATFLLNGGLFVLVGLQIPSSLSNLDTTSTGRAVVVAVVVAIVVIAVRLIFVLVTALLIRAVDRRPAQRLRRVGWRQRTATGWAGFRGGVSLAAVLAVPASTTSGEAFPDRDLVVFATAVVVLVTILVQGLTLPAVVRWARLTEDTAPAEEVRLAHAAAHQAGLAALPRLAAELGADDGIISRVQAEYDTAAAALTAEDGSLDQVTAVRTKDVERRLRLGVLASKRLAVTELRDANRIDDIVLRELQAELDGEELRLLGPAPQE